MRTIVLASLAALVLPAAVLAPGASRTEADPGYPPNIAVEFRYAGLSDLDPGSVLLIDEPDEFFTARAVDELRAFIRAGGNAIVAGRESPAADLVARTNLGIRLTGLPVYSPAFREDPNILIAKGTGIIPDLPAEIEVRRPTSVEGGDPLLVTDPLSWSDQNANGRPDLAEPIGSRAIAAWTAMGAGHLVVIPDAAMLRLDETGFAEAFFAWFVQDRPLVVDLSHESDTDPLGLNALLGGRLPRPAAAGILMMEAAIVVAVAMRPRIVRAVAPPEGPSAIMRDERVRSMLRELDP